MADFAASAANATTGALSFFIGGDSCPTTSTTSTTTTAAAASDVVDRLLRAASSMSIGELSVDVPDFRLGLGELPSGLFGNSPEASNLPLNIAGRYVLGLPDARALMSVLVGTSLATLFGVLIATIIYCLVLRKDGSPTTPSRRGARLTIGSAILSTCFLLPYALIDFFDIRYAPTRFALCALFVLYAFRTLEAMFGFVPTGAAAGRSNLKSSSGWSVYCAYFALPFDMAFDEKTNEPVMANRRDVWDGMVNVLGCLACSVALCSLLSHRDYAPFGETNAGEFHERIEPRDYLDPRHLGNCFAIAIFFQQALALSDAAIANAIQITLGYRVKRMMRNPMLEATSPSDFWGRRWNVLVHSVMKRGVYKPVRAVSSSPVLASLAVFVASGLFHEWIVHAVLIYGRSSDSTTGVLLGSNAAFFLWNFVVIVSEKMLAGTKGAKSLRGMMPRALVPPLIIMTSLPMAHWFGSPYLNGDYMADYEMCLPLVRKVF